MLTRRVTVAVLDEPDHGARGGAGGVAHGFTRRWIPRHDVVEGRDVVVVQDAREVEVEEEDDEDDDDVGFCRETAAEDRCARDVYVCMYMYICVLVGRMRNRHPRRRRSSGRSPVR